MFSEKERAQMAAKGTTPEAVERQLAYFRQGFPPLVIDRAATVDDGILALSPEQIAESSVLYDRSIGKNRIEKFVPASGAATRMFKEFYEYVEQGKGSDVVEKSLARLERFAFFRDLQALHIDRNDPRAVIRAIIDPSGLGYGSQPKGLILFHAYPPDASRTALEEHLVEGAMYGGSPVRIHFTVSPEHQAGFERLVADKLSGYAAKYGVEYQITYSVQHSGTDTIAVGADNQPFREADGTLLFRPGGHGALIENLNRIDADLIFIKTVDNVVPDSRKHDTITYKKVLGGLAIALQQEIFAHLHAIDAGRADTQAIRRFFADRLGRNLPEEISLEQLRNLLDRPVRVCGMVRNEGEPGGGPFWVRGADGVSLQIVESAQIQPEQRPLMQQATHFNPVDLVCAVRNYQGTKFDLTRYVDPDTGFISIKSKDGRELKAQELPGLWNGAMAHWHTLFAEVPISTFAPVKSVVDLLRPEHQSL